VGLMPAEGKGYYANLQNAVSELDQARLNLEVAINERDEIKRQLTGEEPNFGIVAPTQKALLHINPELQKRISDMQSRLDNLLLSYTEEHPDVVSVRRVLKELEEQKGKELELLKKQEADLPKGLANTSLETNPVYQELKIALGKAEASVAGLSTLVADRQRQVDKLKKMVDTVPEIEAELVRLNRGYETNKSNYEELVSRRESARIADEAEKSADDVKFKVVDPPRVPIEPAAPNRLLFSSVVLGGSILAGIVFAFFLTQIRPTFDDHRTVLQIAKVPVFGHISLVRDSRTKFRNRIEVFSFSLVVLSLVALYGAYVWYLFSTKSAAANLF
jgi:polysaccharide chain length determinant protein (PEP-CTERM system associated)